MVEEGRREKGRLSFGKSILISNCIIIFLLIVAIGLLAGFLGQKSDVCDGIVKIVEDGFEEEVDSSVRDGPWKNLRLPKTLVPHHYVIDLQPMLTPDETGLYQFYGKSEVNMTVAEETKYVIIHSRQLNYSKVLMTAEAGSNLPIQNHWLYNDYLVVELNKDMMEGENYTLKTEFTGELKNDLAGFYRATYTDHLNVTREMMEGENHTLKTEFTGELKDDLAGFYRATYIDHLNVTRQRKLMVSLKNDFTFYIALTLLGTMATTQMQSVYARKAFPCFDEPGFKATFDVYLRHQSPNYGLSNMPVQSQETIREWEITKFERTPRMSTYLLAFVVCDLNFTEAVTSGNETTQTRIYARPDQIAAGNTDYAKSITPKILDSYAEFFHVPYPLPKSDQIAVPDFPLGAMENWGLVTYQETRLLFDPSVNSEANKQVVASTVAHELTHQWFGNLISPTWWDELWLNEGFASFIEYLGTDKVEPTWRMADYFIVNDLHEALNIDGLLSSRPIVATDIETEAEINGLFNAISYAKGGCILRMIMYFIGEDAFRLGLKNYLTEYTYGTVDHKKLFVYWQRAIDVTPRASNPPGGFVNAMNTWVLQMGYPVVNIERHATNPRKVVVKQERFLLDPQADPNSPESDLRYTWIVPFWYSTENDSSTSLVWLTSDNELTIDVPSNEYVIGNNEVYGYYRVNYDAVNWKKIIRQLNNNFKKINVKSRGQIIDDSFNLARAKRLNYETALDTVIYLRNDHDFIPWKCAIDVLAYLTKMLTRSKVFGVYTEFLLYLVDPAYQVLAWTEEGSHFEIYLQVNVIDMACSNKRLHCVDNVQERFNQWMADPSNNTISPNLRRTIYCNAVANGDVAEWDFMWEKYKNEEDAQEKAALQYGLTCTRSSWLIKRYLDYTKSHKYIRKQDGSGVLIELCNNEHARDITWDFLRQEWSYFHEVYGITLFAFRHIIEACTSSFSTKFELKELEAFVRDNEKNLGSSAGPFQQAIEQTKANIQWREDNEDIILEWLVQALGS